MRTSRKEFPGARLLLALAAILTSVLAAGPASTPRCAASPSSVDAH